MGESVCLAFSLTVSLAERLISTCRRQRETWRSWKNYLKDVFANPKSRRKTWPLLWAGKIGALRSLGFVNEDWNYMIVLCALYIRGQKYSGQKNLRASNDSKTGLCFPNASPWSELCVRCPLILKHSWGSWHSYDLIRQRAGKARLRGIKPSTVKSFKCWIRGLNSWTPSPYAASHLFSNYVFFSVATHIRH